VDQPTQGRRTLAGIIEYPTVHLAHEGPFA